MSHDMLKKRGKALEDEFFAKKNMEALNKLASNLVSDVRVSPISGKMLVSKVLQGLHVYQCEDSQGVWIDREELQKLKANDTEIQWDEHFFVALAEEVKRNKSHGLLKAAEISEGQRNSPITGKPMAKLQIGEVIIDFCEDSKGIWFDANELSRFIESSHMVSSNELQPWIHLFYKAIGYK